MCAQQTQNRRVLVNLDSGTTDCSYTVTPDYAVSDTTASALQASIDKARSTINQAACLGASRTSPCVFPRPATATSNNVRLITSFT